MEKQMKSKSGIYTDIDRREITQTFVIKEARKIARQIQWDEERSK